MDRRGNNAMRLIKTEEEKNLEKIYAPYYDYTKTPALSPDAPDEAVKAYQKQVYRLSTYETVLFLIVIR